MNSSESNDQNKISVIMSVYNDEKNLADSIESILNQTYNNFEFIIINDGSTDNSKNIIINYKKNDNRIKLIDRKNYGLTKSLNVGIEASNCNFIARQDSDDISHKTRLENQFNFFKFNKDYGLCGSFAEIIDENGKLLKKRKSVSDYKDIKKKLKFSNIFIHPSVMINRKVVSNFYYDERFIVSQDYDLWTRIISKNKGYIIPKFLIKNRMHKSNISHNHSLNQEKNSIVISFLYSFNLQLPSIDITDVAKSFDEIVKYFSNKHTTYREDLKIRKYVYLYKQVSIFNLFKINFFNLHKLIYFYINKPSMAYKRLINLIRI